MASADGAASVWFILTLCRLQITYATYAYSTVNNRKLYVII